MSAQSSELSEDSALRRRDSAQKFVHRNKIVNTIEFSYCQKLYRILTLRIYYG